MKEPAMTLMMKRPKLLAAAFAAALLAGACGTAAGDVGTTTPTDTATEVSTTTVTTSSEAASGDAAAATTENAADHQVDTDYAWDEGDSVAISLDDSSSTAAGDTVMVDGSVVTITAGGTYTIRGTLADGQLIVDSADEEVVRLVLAGTDISHSDGAALAVLDAAKVIIVLAEDTQNRLIDGAGYVFPDASTDEPNAALYSTADLTITGDGSLTVEGNYNDGIGAKDGLVIAGGTITVTAADDGIRGKDYIVVDGGTISVAAGGDGLKADNAEDATKGYITINIGTIDITADGDAISAETDVLVAAGTLTLTTAGGAGGSVGEASAKGIKGLVSVVIDGGTIVADTADDAVHSNNAVTITGGELTLATGDDGVHADATLTITGGTITITESYEGLESAVITIDGGAIEIHADDDGINVAGGQDASGFGGRPGRGGDEFAANSDYQLLINGGTILMYAQGDGLDSNGIAVMTGGIAIVHGPTANNNGAIDAGSFEISGGTLIAVGSAGMAEGVDATSSQAAVQAILGSTERAGTIIHIETSDGESVLTFESAKDYASIVFSSPAVEAGVSYDIYVGGSASGDNFGGMYDASSYTAGTLTGSLTAG
jgi:hypothetical protein